MRSIVTMLLSIALMLVSGSAAFASSNNFHKAYNNSQVVAYYPTGQHAIPGKNDMVTGTDLVMRSGNSGDFLQWFSGTDNTRYMSLWKFVGSATNCSELGGNNWLFIANANASWGSYLLPGNYCVYTIGG